MPPGKRSDRNLLEKVANDPKALWIGMGAVLCVATGSYLLFFSGSSEDGTVSFAGRKGASSKSAWGKFASGKKSRRTDGMAMITNNDGRREQAPAQSPAPATRPPAVAKRSRGAGPVRDSTTMVQDTGRGPGDRALGDISGLKDEFVATGGGGMTAPAGAPDSDQGESASAKAPDMIASSNFGRATGGGGRSFHSGTKGGKRSGVTRGGASGGGVLGAQAGSATPATSSGGGGAPYSGGGGGGGPDMTSSGSGEGTLGGGGGETPGESMSGMTDIGGGGGMGGGGGGSDFGEGEQSDSITVTMKSRGDINKEADKVMKEAAGYYSAVTRPIVSKEKKYVPALRGKVVKAIGHLEAMVKAFKNARGKYGKDADAVINDGLTLAGEEQLPRLRSASKVMKKHAGSLSAGGGSCPYRFWNRYYWWQNFYEEKYQNQLKAQQKALSAHRLIDESFSKVDHARSLSVSFVPIVQREFTRIADDIEKAGKPNILAAKVKAAEVRSLRNTVKSKLNAVTSALPRGLYVGGAPGLNAVKKAAKSQGKKVRARDAQIKGDNLKYPQVGKLTKLQENMSAAARHSGHAQMTVNSASLEMTALISAGKASLETHHAMCSSQALLRELAKKASKQRKSKTYPKE